MKLAFYNTLARKIEEFVPIKPGKVGLYTCGPTVYDFAHIGNFRAYIFEDLLRRTLEFAGYDVYHVMNLTDVDDKTIRTSIEQGLPLREFTAKYIAAFYADLDTLKIHRAHDYPAATDYVEEMKAMIQTLLDKGIAYTTESGDVYFSIEKYPDYGKLANLNMEEMRKGERVSDDEYEKESLVDFALWKGWSERDGDVFWDAPWGKGRPGWHIECSAMATKFLGPHFDIHCGGVDNIFPHHEDEIAQSECCTGEKFVNYWLHCKHLMVEGEKMSKSVGNCYTIPQLLEKGYSGREIRYELLATRYRDGLNFTFQGLKERRGNLERIDGYQARLAKLAEGEAEQSDWAAQLPEWAKTVEADFGAAIADDLNISGALAVLFDSITQGNRAMNEENLTGAQAAAILSLLARLDVVLGFLSPESSEVDADLEALAEARKAAREAKDWGEADRIRDELASKGWKIEDTADGPKLKKL